MASAASLASCAPATPSRTDSLVLVSPTPGSQAAAPTAALPTAAQTTSADGGLQWSAPPEMTIDPAGHYLARFKTVKGDIVVELLADKAPVTVNNFIFLARAGYYDHTTFHRVLPDFMAQGGDPTGTGTGGPGYRFQDEFHPDLTFAEPGLLAMANSGADTNGSQFFITFAPTPHLNFAHTIFGKVVEGMDVALALRLRDPEVAPDFLGDELETVEIEEAAESRLPPPTATPVPIVPTPEEGRPLAELEIAERENIYTGQPAMVIDPARTYQATIATTKGEVVIELHAADAPESVNNFVVLAQLGYWDNFPINYADPTAFVLTGSPAGVPTSDIGYVIPPEINQPHVVGSVGYWYRDDRLGSSGSQFYILLAETQGLDAEFTTFGLVLSGLDVAASLTVDDRVESITIEEQ
jgi:peptidylprolyl isomerase/peptidyl-prolyl cis-trans isomerase B (cyclophilin B)